MHSNLVTPQQIYQSKDKCVHQLFEAQVEHSPDAVAVVFEEEQLTYQELNALANQLAHHLRSLGVKPEMLVGICVERSLEMVIGILGILKAGGAYVPLDPTYPSERLAFMLDDADVSILLTQQQIAQQLLGQEKLQRVCLDVDWQAISRYPTTNPTNQTAPSNLVYVIYTSGSTGLPKGVLLEHKSLVSYALEIAKQFSLQAHEKVLQFAALGFDVVVEEIFPTWLSGATLVLPNTTGAISCTDILQLMQKKEITVVELPTAYWHQLVYELSRSPKALPTSLRLVIIGGEKVSLESLTAWQKFCIPLIHVYGLTEATVTSTTYHFPDHQEIQISDNIGRPIANTQVYILDRHLQPVSVGVSGELHIGGDGLARGYLNRPDLTAEKFIPNPFSNEPGSRLYKTGDLARYLPDGNIEFLGRIDHQVKIRGFRIELGEIEAALTQHPDIQQAIVVVREDIPNDKRLAAYFVVRQAPVSSRELRDFLKQQLPEYMVPAGFVLLDALPLTPNGKVDRRTLPAPEFHPELEQAFVAPRTPGEEMLASIWSTVLKITQIGIYDNFFELGGHSLLATQIIAQTNDTFVVELPLRSLFEAPTIAELAKCVESATKQEPSTQALPLSPISRSANIPLSFAQQRLWFLSQLHSDSTSYNVPIALRLSGQLNIAALESSLIEIICRHEVLRTNFITVEGQPTQVISPTLNLNWQFVDLLHLADSEQETAAQRLVSQIVQQPFNLERGALVRTALLKLSETEHIVVFSVHHIVFDGWSVGVFMRELGTLYADFCADQRPVLSELSVQYADFTIWQQQWLQGALRESQLSYWRKQLENAPVLLELPTDRPRPAIQTFRGAHQSFALSQALSEALASLSRRAGTTLFMTLITAFQTLLYRYTGQDDVCIGTPIANRNHPQIEELIGFFVNTLVLRTDLSGNPSFEQVLKRVREVALDAYAHQDLPFEEIVETLQPTRSLSYTPLFQVMFALQNAPASSWHLPDLTVHELTIETETAKFDLTLELDERPEGIIGRCEYNTDLFDTATIARMIGHFQTLLESIVVNPDQRITKLSLLTETERHQLLVEWNNTKTEYPQDKCIHQLFEEQVERSPDAIAVVFEDQQLTYRELNARANQLAHYLKTLGVEPEVLVGICVERSLEMIVGIIGIVKAGGTYVPLDQAYPQERIAFMLADSAVPVLLTQSSLSGELPAHSAQVVYLDKDWKDINQQSQENLKQDVKANILAYVIYTSGSTGNPKGVCCSHTGVVNLLADFQNRKPISIGERCSLWTVISFDVSVYEIFSPLLNGGSLLISSDRLRLDTKAFFEWLSTNQICSAYLPPFMLKELVKWLNQPLAKLSLQRLLVGVEPIYEQLLVEIVEKVPGLLIINGYGPTEATVCTTLYSVDLQIESYRNTPIGKPVQNTQIYLLDRHLQPVAIGVTGELHIGGAGLARGYLNHPDLTQEKFIPNPFSNAPGSGLYKTGDLARYLPDGNLEFLGRIDHQVKLRGFRIELGEIEAMLMQHSDVQEAIVIAREGDLGRKYLAAYVVSRPEAVMTASALRSYLKAQLPDYMIPNAFVLLEALPLTSNGKIDRCALPSPIFSSELQQSFVEARTPIEKILVQIWLDVLRLDQVGVHDNFFELGGDSILSIQIVARCNQEGLKLTPKDLFQHQTIAELAQIVNSTEKIQAEQGAITGIVPLTPIQHWFLQQQFPEPHHFNQSFIFEVSPDLKSDLLKQVIQHLLVHHDALRLRLVPSGNTWQQINAASEEAELFSLVDLSKVTADEQIGAIEAAAIELQESLNLLSGPILRVTLFNLGANQSSRLLIVIHHLAIDGVSWRVLLEDLAAAYQQLDRREAIVLPVKTTSFQDWAVRLTDYAHLETPAELNYWLNQADHDAAFLPLDFPLKGETNTVANMAEISVSLSIEQTTALLKEVPSAYNTQINDVLLTALVQSFVQWTGRRSLLIDLEGHGREDLFEDVSLTRTVGWFTTMFPVLLKLDEPDIPEKALKSIKEQLRRIPNRGIGYGILRYLSPNEQMRSKLQALPQAEVCFNYLGQLDQMLTTFPLLGLAKESIGLAVSPKGNRSHLLEVNGFVAEGKLQFTLTYSRKLHQQATVKRLAQSFTEALIALISHCSLPEAFGYTPSDFPEAELTQAELDALMQSLNAKQ